MTGHAEFTAEREAMKATAATRAGEYFDRLRELRDAIAGVAPGTGDDQLLRLIANAGEQATYDALDLVGRLKRGAYPDAMAALDENRTADRERRDRDHERTPGDRTHVLDPVEEA